MGRFINADALVSTGQGVLGNNMFAYCLNNPIRFADQTGTVAADPIFPTCIESPGSTVERRLHVDNHSGSTQKFDKFVYEFISADSVEYYINWYNDFEPLANLVAVIKSAKGLRNVYRALEILSVPISGARGWVTMGKYLLKGLWTLFTAITELTD